MFKRLLVRMLGFLARRRLAKGRKEFYEEVYTRAHQEEKKP